MLLEPFSSTPLADGSEKHGFYTPANIGVHLACFFFVLAAGSWKPLRATLAWRPIAFIGLCSYSIYLLQQPVVSFFDENFALILNPIQALAAGCGAAVLSGIVFWFFIERFFCPGHPVYARLTLGLQNRLGALLETVVIPRSFVSVSPVAGEKPGTTVEAIAGT